MKRKTAVQIRQQLIELQHMAQCRARRAAAAQVQSLALDEPPVELEHHDQAEPIWRASAANPLSPRQDQKR